MEEAALIDSFFLPGGILDPDQDEGKEEESSSKVEPRRSSLTTAFASTEAASEEFEAEQRNSFWSTELLQSQPFVPSSKEPDLWPEKEKELLNTATTLFPYESNNFNGSFTQLSSVPETTPRVPPGLAQLSTPLEIGGTTLDLDLGQKPPPSAQEQEDVRQMVLALSSSLQNLGESPDQAPDSPPKIIRRRSSSISGSNRPSTSIHPLELTDGFDSGLQGDEGDDLHSSTSSLSSGSAYQNDSPLQLSDHYCDPETLLLPQDQSLPIEECPFSSPQDPRPMMPYLAAATETPVVPPPPGFMPTPSTELHSLPPSIPSPPPPGFTMPSPPPGIAPKPQSPPKNDPQPANTYSKVVSLPQPPRKVQSASIPPSKNFQAEKASGIRRRNTTTTNTMTTAEPPAAAAPPSDSKVRRRRHNRKHAKNRDANRGISSPTISPNKNENKDQVQNIFVALPDIDPSDDDKGHQQNQQPKKQTKKSSTNYNNTSTTPAKTKTANTTTKQEDLDWSIQGVEFSRQLVRFCTSLLTCIIQEAIKEAIERRSIALDYAVLYVAPLVAEHIMEQWFWLPHFFPEMATAAALSWVCQRVDAEFLLTVGNVPTGTQPQQEQPERPNNKSTQSKKKKPTERHIKHHHHTHGPPDEQRILELRIMEAEICHYLLKNLRWILPALVLVGSIIQTSDAMEGLPCLRLVAAFGLSALKTYNLFSPLSWASGSFQMLLLLGMRDSHTYMQRWCGLEIMIASLGLSTLRFIRLGGALKRTKV